MAGEKSKARACAGRRGLPAELPHRLNPVILRHTNRPVTENREARVMPKRQGGSTRRRASEKRTTRTAYE